MSFVVNAADVAITDTDTTTAATTTTANKTLASQYISDIKSREFPYDITIENIKLRMIEDVYPTGSIGPLFASVLRNPITGIQENDLVLDYGTGTGFLAIVAAKQGGKVVATDVNPMAIMCASNNAVYNKVSSDIEFRKGNF